MANDLILVGGGGHCRSVIDAALSAGQQVSGILDMPELVGTDVMGIPVIGTDDDIERLARAGARFVVTVGFVKSPAVRIKLAARILEAGGALATIVASTARVSPWAKIGAGTVVLHNACVNAGACVGENCIINTLANVDHDAQVGANCHISTGAMINGAVKIGDNCFIGSGVVVYQGVEIASGVSIAGGFMVHKKIFLPGVYAGYPLRRLKSE